MGCFVSRKIVEGTDDIDQIPSVVNPISVDMHVGDVINGNENARVDGNLGGNRVSEVKIPAKSFEYRELVNAAGSFSVANVIGEGGFGKVFKGTLQTGEIVAIKRLNHEGRQGSKEFLVEVLMLSLLEHPNLVNLRGYCAYDDEKLLVYEYMPQGSLEDHLFDLGPDEVPLDWNTRIKIAVDTARGLKYLHCSADPPVILRDLKPANILLDNEFNAKISDFGLAKFGPVGDNTHVSTRVMGTYGYCAPEYAQSGHLIIKSDVYSFGVVLLELITGRKAIDTNRNRREQNLVDWSRPFFKDKRKFRQLADPALRGQYPSRSLYHALSIAFMCLQEQPAVRPIIADVLVALVYVASQPYDPEASSSGRPSTCEPSPSRGNQGR